MSKRFPFPNPVNETSSRLVAIGVVILGLSYLLSGSGWLLVPLLYGFLARVTTGPTFSPLALLATRVITPRLKIAHKFVPGPPKRFAQAIGLLFSATASLLLLLGHDLAARVVIAGLVGAAFLEAAFAVCLGCIIFSWLMKRGLIPESVCLACNNIDMRTI